VRGVLNLLKKAWRGEEAAAPEAAAAKTAAKETLESAASGAAKAGAEVPKPPLPPKRNWTKTGLKGAGILAMLFPQKAAELGRGVIDQWQSAITGEPTSAEMKTEAQARAFQASADLIELKKEREGKRQAKEDRATAARAKQFQLLQFLMDRSDANRRVGLEGALRLQQMVGQAEQQSLVNRAALLDFGR
jgi:hypothetical protein